MILSKVEDPEPILRHFVHLDPSSEVDVLFRNLALKLMEILPKGRDRTDALDRLLCARDYAARAKF